MIFKTIQNTDESGNVNTKIVTALQTRRIAQEQLNATITEETVQLEKDIIALKRYEAALKEDEVDTATFAEYMDGTSVKAQEYATKIKDGTGSTQLFAEQQKKAQEELKATAEASNNTSKSMKVLSVAVNMAATWVISEVILFVIKSLQEWKKAAEEAKQKSLEVANASEEEAKNLQDLYIKYLQLASIQNRTESQENEFKTTIEEVTKALGDKQKALEGVTEETAEYNKELEKATKKEFKDAWGDAKAGLTAAGDALNDIDINGWASLNIIDNTSDYIFRKDILSPWNETEDNKKAIDIIEEKLKKYRYEYDQGYFNNDVFFSPELKDSNIIGGNLIGNEIINKHARTFSISIDDTQKNAEFYNAIGDTLEDLKQANIISTTLSDKAESVGYTLSDSMTGIWDTSTGNITQVLTTYGENINTGISSAATTVNETLKGINENLRSMISQLNTIADMKIQSVSAGANGNNQPSSGGGNYGGGASNQAGSASTQPSATYLYRKTSPIIMK